MDTPRSCSASGTGLSCDRDRVVRRDLHLASARIRVARLYAAKKDSDPRGIQSNNPRLHGGGVVGIMIRKRLVHALCCEVREQSTLHTARARAPVAPCPLAWAVRP